jgi:hypothetical protein
VDAWPVSDTTGSHPASAQAGSGWSYQNDRDSVFEGRTGWVISSEFKICIRTIQRDSQPACSRSWVESGFRIRPSAVLCGHGKEVSQD